MTKVQRTFSLTADDAAFIDGKVASGEYLSDSEVIRDGLRALQDREAAVERWLREEVLPTLLEYEADPSRARPADEVFDELIRELEAETPTRKRA